MHVKYLNSVDKIKKINSTVIFEISSNTSTLRDRKSVIPKIINDLIAIVLLRAVRLFCY